MSRRRGYQAASVVSDSSVGRVVLVGAGPGDPGLITERGLAALIDADEVVYDALVSARTISLAQGRRHFVGKRSGQQELSQEEIESLMVRLARTGSNVCRLKGGDPFLFGRGGEEVEALELAGIEYEVIPGVTAAMGAGAYSGTALTHRDRSSSIAFCTGHAGPIPVPAVDTIVYYMGSASLLNIAESVIEAGWPAGTPVQIIRNATLPQQQITMSNLGQIQAKKVSALSPSVIIVGGAAAGARRSWYERRSKVLVTGLRTEPFAHIGEVIHTPLITIGAAANRAAVRRAIDRLHDTDHIVFTSRTSVDYFLRELLASGQDIRALANCTLAAIGDSTVEALSRFALCADLVGNGSGAEGLLSVYRAARVCGSRILLPTSDIARITLAEGLRAEGNQVEVLTVYQTRRNDNPILEDLSSFTHLALSSPSGVDAFHALYGEKLPSNMQIIVLGELTAEAVHKVYPNHEVHLFNG